MYIGDNILPFFILASVVAAVTKSRQFSGSTLQSARLIDEMKMRCKNCYELLSKLRKHAGIHSPFEIWIANQYYGNESVSIKLRSPTEDNKN